MTKLVTGIEAIQSGKLVRYIEAGKTSGWFDPSVANEYYTYKELTNPCYEIKQEPREFWVRTYFDGHHRWTVTHPNDRPDDESEWIKVREVLENG